MIQFSRSKTTRFLSEATKSNVDKTSLSSLVMKIRIKNQRANYH